MLKLKSQPKPQLKPASQPCFLLTGDPREIRVADPQSLSETRARNQDIKVLYQLASDYDSSDPDLAAQLRAIAGRL